MIPQLFISGRFNFDNNNNHCETKKAYKLCIVFGKQKQNRSFGFSLLPPSFLWHLKHVVYAQTNAVSNATWKGEEYTKHETHLPHLAF